MRLSASVFRNHLISFFVCRLCRVYLMLRISVLYNNLVNLQNTVPLINTVDGNGRTVQYQNEVKRIFTVLFKVLKLNLSWEQRQFQLSNLPPSPLLANFGPIKNVWMGFPQEERKKTLM
jgi:hypothetical protein